MKSADADIDGAQPRCPDCKVLMRPEAGGDVCPVCGHREEWPEVVMPAADGPGIHGG